MSEASQLVTHSPRWGGISAPKPTESVTQSAPQTAPYVVSDDEVRQALILHAGSISRAAVELGVYRTSLAARVKGSAAFLALLDEIDERLLDVAKSNVAEALIEGDRQMTRWYLERKGAKDGFSTRVLVGGDPNAAPIKTELTVRVRYVDPLPITDEEEPK